MTLSDIPRVYEIDQLSFPVPWTPQSYGYEVKENPNAYMTVLETRPTLKSSTWIGRLFQRALPSQMVGYSGLWVIAGEAHISTIAVHPEWRGKSLGEVLLNDMIGQSLALESEYCVLEVRASNLTAQKLYEKYKFEMVGRRRGYYKDNAEDALLMHLSFSDPDYRRYFADLSTQLAAKVSYTR
jgi:ribosomal-protein-alanine N-acetyltransferase